MLQFIQKYYNKIFITGSVAMTLLVAFRAYFIPFAHDEVATFYFYIQPGSFIPFHAHIDANGHFLTNLTSWLSYKLFGASPFALRLPNLFAFILLCYACFKMSNLLNGIYGKLILFFGFILAFHFSAFFSLCRGYGLSMAFLLWSLVYFFQAIQNNRFKDFVWFIIGAQLALAANLTLVFVLLICSLILIVFQWLHNKKLNPKVVAVYTIHFLLLLFWIKYAFYLQHNGALYYGSGDSYWQVSFVSLIETVFFKNYFLNLLIALLFAVLAVYWSYALYQHRWRFLSNSQFALAFMILTALVISFYLLKVLFHVNYPEDRTGLFFYVFFVLALAFKVDETSYVYRNISLIFPLFVTAHFIWFFNIRTHPWRIYETFPTSFIDKLMAEQKAAGQKITVGGHRLREFIYGFINYNKGGELNHMTSPEALQMNADYAVAYRADEPYYRNYYRVIDSEPTWDFVLLKRKKPIAREVLFEEKKLVSFNGMNEYNNAFEMKDTVFDNSRPFLAEFNLKIYRVPVPFNAWLVLQIDDADNGKKNVLVRVPLNLIRKNLHQKDDLTLHVLSGNVPKNIKRLVCYLWNIDKKPIEIQLTNFKLYRLQGEGVEAVSQAKL